MADTFHAGERYATRPNSPMSPLVTFGLDVFAMKELICRLPNSASVVSAPIVLLK